MEEQLPRRSFLGRLMFGLGTILAAPAVGVADGFKKAMKPENEEKMEAIRAIRPMGFQWETLDPFLFCVHHEDDFPKGNDAMGPAVSLKGRSLGDDFIIKDGFRMYHGRLVPGFPGHPHRGFETITVVRKGLVDHADSMGAAGRYGNGDVQWMTAGKGVQHSEMFPLLNKEKDNPLELFQIWLNLPKKSKMVNPHFKMFWAESIPKVIDKDKSGKKTTIEVMVGKFGVKNSPTPPPDSWAADANNHVSILNIKMDAGAEWVLPKAVAGLNRTLYFYQGVGIQMNGKAIPKYHAVDLKSDEDIKIINGNHETGILMLQGKPINEPVIQYGPFVMNTKEEINQAFDDYHRTKFGGWPWPKYDQVHPRERGRFARHADGKEEVKS